MEVKIPLENKTKYDMVNKWINVSTLESQNTVIKFV